MTDATETVSQQYSAEGIKVGVSIYPEDLDTLLKTGELTLRGVREDHPVGVTVVTDVTLYLVP